MSQITTRALNELGVEVLFHPPYSPDLEPNNGHCSKHFQSFRAGRTLDDDAKTVCLKFVASPPPSLLADGINQVV